MICRRCGCEIACDGDSVGYYDQADRDTASEVHKSTDLCLVALRRKEVERGIDAQSQIR